MLTGARPGLIRFVQTFGDLANFNPHVHVLAADGAFLADGTFVPLPPVPEGLLVEGFRRAVLEFLVQHAAISGELRIKHPAASSGVLTALINPPVFNRPTPQGAGN